MHQELNIKGNRTLRVWRQSLERKYADLDALLLEESRHPLPNADKIEELAQSRLRIKDELAAIEGVLRTINAPA